MWLLILNVLTSYNYAGVAINIKCVKNIGCNCVGVVTTWLLLFFLSVDVLYIHRQSAYLVGRERKV